MKASTSRKLLSSGMLILTSMIWGLAFAVQRIGAQSVMPAAFTSCRMALAALTVSFVLPFSRKPEETRMAAGQTPTAASQARKETLRGGLICGAFLSAACLLQQMGLAWTTAGKAGFLTAMYILFVPVIQALVFKKRNPPAVWLGVAMGILGMYLLCMEGGLHLTRGDALVSLCALLYSGHILCCGHFARRADPLRLAALQFLTCAALTGLLAVFIERPDPRALLSAAPEILYCGVLSGGVGYTLQMVAQRFTEPAVASLLMSLESVFAAAAGALVLQERMQPRELLGCIVMFAAILVVQLPDTKNAH